MKFTSNKIPVIFANSHSNGTWTSENSTDHDTCSYVEQSDGSILINTMHQYANFDYCHEYWECENPDHNMFYKWNRVQIEDDYPDYCEFDWARFAWGTQQEYICTEWNELSDRQKRYRDRE